MAYFSNYYFNNCNLLNATYHCSYYHFLYISIYSACFVILLASIKVKNKGRVVLISIILVQLSLISAKFDNLVEMSWKQILILLLPISLISLSALIFLSLYSLMLKRYYSETFLIKKYTLMFLTVNFLGICAILGFILG